jgi:hypothetical protein
MAQAWLLLACQAEKNAPANFGGETAKPPGVSAIRITGKAKIILNFGALSR